MAMLAEPRRRVKYSTDPRGLNWSNDDNKFGQKLMEKMGWSKGKGLGAKETGDTEHIKISVKNDSRGVGCTANHADNWIAHQDDFNDLLASLNQDHANDSGEEKGKKLQSLEERSKSSKKRVHYHKFAKGKDLSMAKNDDLDCVLGKRKSKSEPSTPQVQSEANSDAESAESNPEIEESGVKTFTSGSSVQEYFAKKMAALKKIRAEKSDENSQETGGKEDSEIEDEPVVSKKMKKKKKDKKKEQEDIDYQPVKKKKKIKLEKTISDKSTVLNKEEFASTKMENEDSKLSKFDGTEVAGSEKKKKKKSKNGEFKKNPVSDNADIVVPDECTQEKRKSKKRKNTSSEDSQSTPKKMKEGEQNEKATKEVNTTENDIDETEQEQCVKETYQIENKKSKKGKSRSKNKCESNKEIAVSEENTGDPVKLSFNDAFSSIGPGYGMSNIEKVSLSKNKRKKKKSRKNVK